jgi:cytochrome c nitrite reductase small subunit
MTRAAQGGSRKARPSWRRVLVVAALGGVAGLGLAVARVSRATSYLSDAPETCINCHVMTPQYLSYRHSAHARVATCNDCHVPQDNFVRHYLFKARDGARHATIFTLRTEPQVIRLSAGAIPVVEQNCRRCHAEQVHAVSLAAHERDDMRCWDCHRDVPHGTVRSLSARPTALRPHVSPLGAGRDRIEIGGREPQNPSPENSQ